MLIDGNGGTERSWRRQLVIERSSESEKPHAVGSNRRDSEVKLTATAGDKRLVLPDHIC